MTEATEEITVPRIARTHGPHHVRSSPMTQTRRTPTERAQRDLDKADADLAEVRRMKKATADRLEDLDEREASLLTTRDYLAAHPLLQVAKVPVVQSEWTSPPT